MAIIYKILCDVKWMHEYYLTGNNGQSVFDFPLQSGRINFLFEQFRKDIATINSNLDFLAPEPLKPQFSNKHLKIIPSYSGFKVAVRCNTLLLPDGRTVYRPLAEIPGSEEIMIGVRERSSIRGFSNMGLSSPFQRAFYFSNDQFPSAKTFPFLPSPVPAFDATVNYIQGDIALFGLNDTRMFLNNGEPDPWLPLPAGNYITGADRMIAPLSFIYNFSIADNVSDAEFLLTDNNGDEIKKITSNGNTVLRSVPLNFRLPGNPIKALPSYSPRPESRYTLTVTSSNGYAKTFNILFVEDSMDITNHIAVIGLKLKSSNTTFNLTDNDGYLITKIAANGIKTEPPVLELWMKSRLVYWRYRNNRQKKIKLTLDTQDLLTEDDGILITKVPQRLSHSPFLLKKPDNSFQYLPNPAQDGIVRLVGSKLFVDITIPGSKMFPLV
jgi:hypothetical protein